MALLWVIQLKLCARLTDLLDNEVFGMALDDALDSGRFVSGDDNEPESLFDDSLVFARRDRQLLDTGSVTALTVKRQRASDVVPFCPFVDPLVDLTEDLFVSCSSVRELHPATIACGASKEPPGSPPLDYRLGLIGPLLHGSASVEREYVVPQGHPERMKCLAIVGCDLVNGQAVTMPRCPNLRPSGCTPVLALTQKSDVSYARKPKPIFQNQRPEPGRDRVDVRVLKPAWPRRARAGLRPRFAAAPVSSSA